MIKSIVSLLLIITIVSCDSNTCNNKIMIEQTKLQNVKIQEYVFLDDMYKDAYFPDFLVDKCKNILLELCSDIENKKPSNLEELYILTHASTNKLNDLEEEFSENDSEIETAARECLAMDFEFVAITYGFEADLEELIATRDW